MSCGSGSATLVDLARTCVGAGQTFELAQTELHLKCGAVMLLQLKSLSADLHAIFSFISVSLFHASSFLHLILKTNRSSL